MSVPIPLRRDFSAPQLRSLAKKTKDGPQARRLLTLAAIYDRASRTEAAKIGGVGLQIIRDWVLRVQHVEIKLPAPATPGSAQLKRVGFYNFLGFCTRRH
jgi:hypothetical protein